MISSSSLWISCTAARLGQDRELPPGDSYIVFPTKSQLLAKTRALMDFMLSMFAAHRRVGKNGGKDRPALQW